MASEDQVTGRPRPWLLVLLAVVVAAAALTWLWPTGAAPAAAPASPATRQGAQRSQAKVQAGDLRVHLDVLATPPPELQGSERNPFRFRPPPPPPPPPPGPKIPANGPGTAAPVIDTGPPPPPPIPLKFIGVVEKQGLRVAALSDCRTTYHGSEGQIIDGRYRLVSIGVESIVLEYVDGRGRTTVRQDGCSPR